MQSKVNYVTVGVFVVVLSAVLLAIIVWLTTVGHGKNYKTYLVYVHEDVTGLSVESPVRFNGVKVGYIESINLDPNNPRLVKLDLRIESHAPVTTSTYAILNAQGVTGVVYLNLKAETENAPLLVPTPGNPYPVIPSRPSLLMQLSTALPEITSDIQHLSSSIASVLDNTNRESIKNSLQNIDIISKTLTANAENFSAVMHSLQESMVNISEASKGLPETVDQLNKTLSSVDQLSGTISATMKSGQTAIHHFSDQVIPSAQQALSNLSAATAGVDQLTDELQRDPSMLVRGKVPPTPGPGEK